MKPGEPYIGEDWFALGDVLCQCDPDCFRVGVVKKGKLIRASRLGLDGVVVLEAINGKINLPLVAMHVTIDTHADELYPDQVPPAEPKDSTPEE